MNGGNLGGAHDGARSPVPPASPAAREPTGGQLPLTRRVALLAWASTADATVLEDARCDDLLVTPAATCLHGLDDEARVVQLGGFGALFHPGIHLAYAVLPRPRVAPFAAAVAALDPGATPVQQRALGRFVVDGDFERQLVRVRRTLAERLDAAIDALRRELGWLVSVDAPAGGTRVVATIEDDRLTAVDAARAAERVGVLVEPLDRHRIAPAGDRELVLDVARVAAADVGTAIGLLAGAMADEHGRVRAARAVRRDGGPTPIPRRWPAMTHHAGRRHDGPVASRSTRSARASTSPR